MCGSWKVPTLGENLSEGEGIGHLINVTEDRIRQTFTGAL